MQDHSAYKQSIRDQVNQLLYLIYALLGLAVVIAILGIVNTLALSVIERTREIGLLRAVGTTRKQLRRMIRLESVVISVYGALLGVVLGRRVRRRAAARPADAGHRRARRSRGDCWSPS